MTRRRIPCTLSSRVISPSSDSGSLGRVSTLGKIGQMALLFVHGKCQHYYESGQPRYDTSRNVRLHRDERAGGGNRSGPTGGERDRGADHGEFSDRRRRRSLDPEQRAGGEVSRGPAAPATADLSPLSPGRL